MIIRDFTRMHQALEKRKKALEASVAMTDKVNALVEDLTKDVNKRLSALELVTELLVLMHFIWLFLYTFMDFDKKHWSDTKVFFFVLLFLLVALLVASLIFLVKNWKRKRLIMASAGAEMEKAQALEDAAHEATEEAAREVPYIIALSEDYDDAKSAEDNRLMALSRASAIEEDIRRELGPRSSATDIVRFYEHWAAVMTGEVSATDLDPLANERKLRYLGRPEDLSSYEYTKEQIDREKRVARVNVFSDVVFYIRLVILILFALTFLAEAYAVFDYTTVIGNASVRSDLKQAGYLLFLVLFPLEAARSIALSTLPADSDKARHARTWRIVKPYFALVAFAVLYFIFYATLAK